MSCLQSLVTKRFEVNGPGVQQFFQGEGAETLKLVKNSCTVQILPIDQKQKSGKVPTRSTSLQILPVISSAQQSIQNCTIRIEVVASRLEEQQVRLTNLRCNESSTHTKLIL